MLSPPLPDLSRQHKQLPGELYSAFAYEFIMKFLAQLFSLKTAVGTTDFADNTDKEGIGVQGVFTENPTGANRDNRAIVLCTSRFPLFPPVQVRIFRGGCQRKLSPAILFTAQQDHVWQDPVAKDHASARCVIGQPY